MNKLLSQIAQPVKQAEFQQGRLDGDRYYGEGHMELLVKYQDGSADYRMGFESAAELARATDPDYAS